MAMEHWHFFQATQLGSGSMISNRFGRDLRSWEMSRAVSNEVNSQEGFSLLTHKWHAHEGMCTPNGL